MRAPLKWGHRSGTPSGGGVWWGSEAHCRDTITGRSFFMGYAGQQMDFLSLKLMSEAIKSLKGHNQLRTSPKPHLWGFHYLKWLESIKSGARNRVQGVWSNRWLNKERVLLGDPRSCHRCGRCSHHLPDPLCTLGIVEFGHQNKSHANLL